MRPTKNPTPPAIINNAFELPEHMTEQEYLKRGKLDFREVFNEENARIEQHLGDTAEAEHSRPTRPTPEHMREFCNHQCVRLGNKFGHAGIHRDPRLEDAVRSGVLARHCPSKASIAALDAVSWVAVCLELGVGVMQMLVDSHATVATLIPLAFLAIGGRVAGSGLAYALCTNWASPLPTHVPQVGPELGSGLMNVLKVAAGVAMVAGATWWRMQGGSDSTIIVMITLALASVIAVTHAAAKALSSRRIACFRAGYHAAQIWAADLHQQAAREAELMRGPWVSAFLSRCCELRELDSSPDSSGSRWSANEVKRASNSGIRQAG